MKRDHDIDCQRVAQLLPWYVNHSLSPREHSAVHAHVAECNGCAREAEFLQDVRIAMPAPRASTATPDSAAPFSALLRKINRRERREQTWKAAAAVALLIAGIAAIALPAYLFEPRFRAVTDTIPAHAGIAQLELRFTNGGGAHFLPQLLTRYDADIVEGPDDNGNFVLEFRLAENESVAELKHRLAGESQLVLVQRDSGRTQDEQQ